MKRPWLVFLHGQPGGSGDFAAVRARLGSETRVLCEDRPGWGTSVLAARGLADNATWIADIVRRRGDSEPVVIVGYSLGAAVAVLAGSELSETRIGLVLVSPAITVSSLVGLDRVFGIPVLGRIVAHAVVVGAYRQLSSPGHATHRRSFLTEQSAFIAEISVVEEVASRLRCPVSILAGGRDRIVSPGSILDAAATLVPQRLRVLSEQGHDLLVTAPSDIASEVVALLVELGGIGDPHLL